MAQKYQISRTFKKIACLKKKIKIIQGGKGSSKTISILQLFILLASSKKTGLILSIVAQSMPNLKSGAIRDFEFILKDWGLYSNIKINNTDRTYKFTNGNIIEFFSIDTESSRLGSRRTHLYVNEADSIKFETFLELEGRTHNDIYIDFNPRRKFWVHDEMIGRADTDFIIVTYEDNEYLPKAEVDSLLEFKKKADETGSRYWENKWRVLGLGQLGLTQGVVFEEGIHWNIIDQIPETALYLGAGLDFGFRHATAIVKLYQGHHPDDLYLTQTLFKSELTAPDIAQVILSDIYLMDAPIIADSARPEMIKELVNRGCPVLSHKKGSVVYGIDLMHSKRIFLTKDSEEMIEEFRSYAWKNDKTGKSIGVPDKAADNDNAIDAARYAIEHFCSKAVSRTNRLKWLY